jgi:hypothetical protein
MYQTTELDNGCVPLSAVETIQCAVDLFEKQSDAICFDGGFLAIEAL